MIIICSWIRAELKQKRDDFIFPSSLILLIENWMDDTLKQKYLGWDQGPYGRYISYNHVLITQSKRTILGPSITGKCWHKYVYKITVYEISNNSCVGMIFGDFDPDHICSLHLGNNIGLKMKCEDWKSKTKIYGLEFDVDSKYAMDIRTSWGHYYGGYDFCNKSICKGDYFKFEVIFKEDESYRRCEIQVTHYGMADEEYYKTLKHKALTKWKMSQAKDFGQRYSNVDTYSQYSDGKVVYTDKDWKITPAVSNWIFSAGFKIEPVVDQCVPKYS